MPFSAEVICVKDHNEDHEVGGHDLPVVVTLAAAPQHTAATVAMVEAGLGAFPSSGRSTFVPSRLERFSSQRLPTSR